MTATTTTVTAVSIAPFDEWSPRYRCCCGCCHVRCGTYVIGCLQAIGLASLLFNSGKAAYAFDSDVNGTAYIPTVLHAGFFVCCVICVILLFVGLSNERASFLTPMMILLLFSIGYYVLVAVLFVIAYAVNSDALTNFLQEQLQMHGSSHYDKEIVRHRLKISMIIIVITSVIGALFDFWWYTVIKRCRHYLRDKAAWYLHHPGAHQFSVPLLGNNVVLITQQMPHGGAAGAYQPLSAQHAYNAPAPTDYPPAAPPSYNDVIKDGGKPTMGGPPNYAAPSAPPPS